MAKLYAFLWHVNHSDMVASEGAGGSRCESAETEKPTEREAEKVLRTWLDKQQKACGDTACEHTPIITGELRPKMIMSGMTTNMVRVN